ncbi:WG repeat-containing protein [uncultured Marivirga sp.]|uniref:tetratricopeptide repeat protein n=1 Tax=uncultured Marivirga sp. TaxID=1123707 RepID=UPI0030EC8CF2|tara:strand:+ start:338864 stop:341431 length:2568 start_codon:yes stop_codon:yes gene_type:complete
MNQKLFFLLIIITSFFWSSCVHKALKANKFLEKKELAKAKKRIDKAVEKEPKDPATQFMLAKYFSHPVWSHEAVDSAHLYIQMVRDTMPYLDVETAVKLSKKGLDSTAVAKQGMIIDSLAFEKALSKNTEEAYNEYLENYQYLIYKTQATDLRNQVAYTDAIAQNTTQAVSEFFRKYPEAPQAQKARNVFETLYYEKKTQNQTVEEYKEYLSERPQSEFAEEASLKLLNIISSGADEIDFQQFINEYGQFQAAEKAQAMLDGLNFQKRSPVLLTHKRDSLYFFYDLTNAQLLTFQFSSVNPDSCFFITKPYILGKRNGEKRAYLKTGQQLTDLNFKSIDYLGSGFFKINDYGREQIIEHFSLNPALQLSALNFQKINDFHFAKKETDGWHLVSLLNEPILRQTMDSIWKEEEVFFFIRGDDLAVASSNDFRKSAKDDLKSLSFLYDDYEWISDQYLRLYSNDYETILDKEGQLVFPLEKAKYDYFDQFWIKNVNKKYSVLDSNRVSIYDQNFDDFKYRFGILALKKDSLWTVFENGVTGFPKFQYDSVRLFNSWLTFATKDSSKYLLFRSGKRINLEKGEGFKILKNYNVELSNVSDQIRFVQVTNVKGYSQLFNGFGKKIKEGENLNINILTQHLIQIHQNKKKQLIDSSGIVIPIEEVEAFGAYENGLIPILQKRKFGALIVDSLKLIPAHSQSKLKVFLKDSLYIFKHDNLFGISDISAKNVIEADFEAIDYFNDSIAIVEEEGEIGILNIYRNEYLHEAIESFEKVRLAEEKYFIIRKRAGYGVLNQKGEEVIPFIFNELKSFESKGKFYWLAERRLSEINYIVIAYFDKRGKVLFKEGLNFDDFLETACD